MDENKINALLSRGVEEVIVEENLRKKLLSGKQLRIKLGIDPTGSVLHLGHMIVLNKLKDFQDLGHQVIFLIGDFTARIGDPTGRISERPPMTDAEIESNMADYVKQAGLILDTNKLEIRYNSEWLGEINFASLLELTSKVTYAQIARRADFKQRIKNDVDLSLQEFLYPIMQGYDSVALKSDVEIGGTDQKFNLLMGRQLQKRYEQEEQDIITCPLLEGLRGKDKMSKSLDNYVAFTDSPSEMYGKIMSVADNLIVRYFELCARIDAEDLKEIEKEIQGGKNPKDLKMKLAFEIVRIFHGEGEAEKAERAFVEQFQKGLTPENIELRNVGNGENILELLVAIGFVKSKGEARRKIEEGAVKIDGEKITDQQSKVEFGEKTEKIIQLGRRIIKIVKK